MIDLHFTGDMDDARRDAFDCAARRWDAIIETGFEPIDVEGATLDGVLIEASIAPIDGVGHVLGQAGPTHLRPNSHLPAKGIMAFDAADIAALEEAGSFRDVILHEMAHVLGFGTLWALKGLIAGSGTTNPRFVGEAASAEYTALAGHTAPTPVPVANTGGAGTREGHWRELVFGDELLTGFLSGQERPISRMSVASFADLGYAVDFAKADAYTLPTFRQLAEMGLTEAVRVADLCNVDRPRPVILPPRGS